MKNFNLACCVCCNYKVGRYLKKSNGGTRHNCNVWTFFIVLENMRLEQCTLGHFEAKNMQKVQCLFSRYIGKVFFNSKENTNFLRQQALRHISTYISNYRNQKFQLNTSTQKYHILHFFGSKYPTMQCIYLETD